MIKIDKIYSFKYYIYLVQHLLMFHKYLFQICVTIINNSAFNVLMLIFNQPMNSNIFLLKY